MVLQCLETSLQSLLDAINTQEGVLTVEIYFVHQSITHITQLSGRLFSSVQAAAELFGVDDKVS